MLTKIEQFNLSQQKTDLPDIKPGDTILVHQKIKEGNPSTSFGTTQDKGSGQVKERIQVFEGVVIAKKHGKGPSATITVRKVVEGIGVERIFPIHSPVISKIEVVKHGKVRRAKLYYLRTTKGKKAKIRKKEFAAAIVEDIPIATETTEEIIEETTKE